MISVILCTYNRASLLEQAIADLLAQNVSDGFAWEIVVVDNNSSDDTRAVVQRAIQHTTTPIVYAVEKRQGKSNALNAGIALAKGDLLLFTDDDVRIDPTWVAAMNDAFLAKEVDFAGGRLLATWETSPPPWYGRDEPYPLMDAIVQFDLGPASHMTDRYPYGANMAVRKGLVEAVGGFSPVLGPLGDKPRRGEDTDLCERLFKAGKRCIYVAEAIVHHPVEKERISKSYFLGWYYWYGTTSIKKDGLPAGTVRIFGVPRHLIRQLLESALRWATSFAPRRRFFYKLETWMVWGSIAQSSGWVDTDE